MISTIGKAISRKGERERLEKLRKLIERRLKVAYEEFLASFEDSGIKIQIREAIATNNIDTLITIAATQASIIGNAVPLAMITTAVTEMDHLKTILPKNLKGPSVSIGFDPSHPRAAEKMQAAKLELVTEFTNKQRDSVRQALTRAFQTGEGPRKVATAFVDSVGLTSSQEAAVANYRALLESGSQQALERDLRDRRFDRTVARAVATDTPLSQDAIDRMVKRYRDNYHRFRAETIARTESTRALSISRQEASIQMAEDIGIDPNRIVRVWNATLDSRVRDIHASMDGDEVRLEEPFTDGAGNQLMFPGDPSAPPETTINCRCTVSTRIRD